MDVFFFEAFEEEEKELKKHLPAYVNAGFSWKTIQEYGSKEPPAKIISTRTQSEYPLDWARKLEGILSRSTGYDHLKEYQKSSGIEVNCGYLPLYCHRAVAEHALMLWMSLITNSDSTTSKTLRVSTFPCSSLQDSVLQKIKSL